MARPKKTVKKEEANIQDVATQFQEISREIKAKEAIMKPLKEQLINYANEHTDEFDDENQLKFANGTYVSVRVKDVLDGTSENLNRFLKDNSEEFGELSLNEKLVIEEALRNAALRKKLQTRYKINLAVKETMAVYAD